jgi:hypothetical protein
MKSGCDIFAVERRRPSENDRSCSGAPPIVQSSLTPLPPPHATAVEKMYHNNYLKLKKEFHTATQVRQNTSTLTNNFAPVVLTQHIDRQRIVFPEYEPQKQCLYVRPKGLLQTDPHRLQITPSELTMLRERHQVALTQVDLSPATGEVRMLKTPATSICGGRDTDTLSSAPGSIFFNTSLKTASVASPPPPTSNLRQQSDASISTANSHNSSKWKQKKYFVIPLPHNTVYNSTENKKSK